MKNIRPLQEYLDTLPEPKTFNDKVVYWWSNFIDDVAILKWKIQMFIKHRLN